jgi:hypothetical protein
MRHSCATVALLILSLAATAGGCSSSGNPPTDGGPAGDAAPSEGGASEDAPVDAASTDGSCHPAAAVWAASDVGFTESSLGGFAPAVPADAGCTTSGTIYDFSEPAKTLRGRDCSYLGSADKTVALSDAQLQEALTAVEALGTDCPPSDRCGADFPLRTFSVSHGEGTAPSAYSGDFYAGCSGGQAPPGPYIAEDDLTALENVLRAIVFPPGTEAGGD